MAAGTDLDYPVSPTDLEEPKDERSAFHGAEELRLLKAYVNSALFSGVKNNMPVSNCILQNAYPNPYGNVREKAFTIDDTAIRINADASNPFVFTYGMGLSNQGRDDRIKRITSNLVLNGHPQSDLIIRHILAEYNTQTDATSLIATFSRPFSGYCYDPEDFWLLDQTQLNAYANGTNSVHGGFGENYLNNTAAANINVNTGFDAQKWLRFNNGAAANQGFRPNYDKSIYTLPAIMRASEYSWGCEFYFTTTATINCIASQDTLNNTSANIWGWLLYVSATTPRLTFNAYAGSATATIALTGTTPLTINTAYTVRIERSRGYMFIYLNNVLELTVDLATANHALYMPLFGEDCFFSLGTTLTANAITLQGGLRNIWMVPYIFRPTTMANLRTDLKASLPQFIHSITGQHMKITDFGVNGALATYEASTLARIPVGAYARNAANNYETMQLPARLETHKADGLIYEVHAGYNITYVNRPTSMAFNHDASRSNSFQTTVIAATATQYRGYKPLVGPVRVDQLDKLVNHVSLYQQSAAGQQINTVISASYSAVTDAIAIGSASNATTFMTARQHIQMRGKLY